MWTARTLLDATLKDVRTIRESIAHIPLNAGALLVGGAGEEEDKTVVGIMMTLRSAAFANLRILAWASESVPAARRFSVKKWLAAGYTGPLTIIAQYSPQNARLSSLVVGSLIKRIALSVADASLAVDPRRRVVLALDEFNCLEKTEGLADALAVGREKGLCVILGIQSVDQVILKYGSERANVIFGLFQIKIYGRLEAGNGATLVSEWMGKRDISALVKNRRPMDNDKRWHVEERRKIETYSATRLAAELGVIELARGRSLARAVVHCFGQVFRIDWPLTLWNKSGKAIFQRRG